jgi:hypothetical protein
VHFRQWIRDFLRGSTPAAYSGPHKAAMSAIH